MPSICIPISLRIIIILAIILYILKDKIMELGKRVFTKNVEAAKDKVVNNIDDLVGVNNLG